MLTAIKRLRGALANEWVDRRAVRVDRDGRRLPGEYVVGESWPRHDPLFNHNDYWIRLIPAKGQAGRSRLYRKTNIRIEGVDEDFATVLARRPVVENRGPVDKVRELRSTLRAVWEQKIAEGDTGRDLCVRNYVGAVNARLRDRVRRALGG